MFRRFRLGVVNEPLTDKMIYLRNQRVFLACTPRVNETIKKYLSQVSVHSDDPLEVTRVSFRRFLVDSPLIRESLGSTTEGAQCPARRKAGNLSAPPGDDRDRQEVSDGVLYEGGDGVGSGQVVGRHAAVVILEVGIVYPISIAKILVWCVHERWYCSR